MTRKGRRLIEDFLLPSLNEGKYGDLLKWVDQLKGHFSIRWSHKNAAKWTLEDTLVFQDWDRLKGRYRPEQKGYFMQAKQRFRAALYKLSTVEQLSSPDKHVKHYRLCLNKKNDIIHKRMQKLFCKSENGGIPTPVICKNTLGRGTELVGRDYLEESSSDSSSTSPFSIKSEDCDQAQDQILYEEKDYQEYQNALKRQRKQFSPNHYLQEVVKTENFETPQSCILRESPQINIVRKAPHVLSQVVPVYNNKNISHQTIENVLKSEELSIKQQEVQNILVNFNQLENTQRRVESPKIFFVPTYNISTKKKEDEVVRYLAKQYVKNNSEAKDVAKDSEKCSLKDSEKCSLKDSEKDALKDSEKGVSMDFGKDALKDSANSALPDSVKSALNDTQKNSLNVTLNGVLNLSVKCDTSVLCR